jgi:hypothetical protein
MITFSIGVFFWLSIFYLWLKRGMKWSIKTDFVFAGIVFLFMGSMNMTMMMECSNPGQAWLYTFLPWFFMFVPLLIALHYFPSWKIPFSNTLGYFIISFQKDNINTLINLLKEEATDITKLEVLRSPWLLFNQFTSDMFDSGPNPTVTNPLAEPNPIQKGNVFLKCLKLEDTANVQKLKDILELKDSISIWVWYMLVALIAISTSYTLIMNSSCAKDVNLKQAANEIKTQSKK